MISVVTGWDWFVIGVFTLSVLWGLARGLVKSIFAVLSWVVALLGAPQVAQWMTSAFEMQKHDWSMVVVAFLVIFFAVRVIGGVLSRGAKSTGLGMADRFLGGILGALRAALIVVVAANAAAVTGLSEHDAWKQAGSRGLLERCVQWLAITPLAHPSGSDRKT
jgi:uncharacterized membrane protein required for colicin V production